MFICKQVLVRYVSPGEYKWDSPLGHHAFYQMDAEAAAAEASGTCGVVDFITLSSSNPCPVLPVNEELDCTSFKS